jgi:leader peptidase (prepilin peptidase) / N-methyltransferase
MPLDAAHWLIVMFATVFGGCVGSFLNVVIYRLPNRLSLISPPSHCPMCKKPICWYDNVPVFGWIMLGGHCRNCNCSIPIRYPLVEAFTAAMFAALAVVEDPLTAAYPCHLLLLCTLLCSALIEFDKSRPPLSLFVPALIVGIVVPIVWPTKGLSVWAGLAAGIAASGVVWFVLGRWWQLRLQGSSDTASPYAGLPLGLLCTGPCLGWLAVAAIAAAVLAVHVLLLYPWRGEPRISVPPSVWLLIAAIAWLLA